CAPAGVATRSPSPRKFAPAVENRIPATNAATARTNSEVLLFMPMTILCYNRFKNSWCSGSTGTNRWGRRIRAARLTAPPGRRLSALSTLPDNASGPELLPASRDSGFGHFTDVEVGVQIGVADAGLASHFAHRLFRSGGFLGDPGRLVVSNQRIERRRDRRIEFQQLTTPFPVGLDAIDAQPAECVGCTREDFDTLEDSRRHDRHHDVQLEIA